MMLKNFKTMLLLFIFTNLVYSEDCSSEYMCTKNINKQTKMTEFKCTVKNIPIIAEDVFETNGSLKTYFGTGEDVCNVLDWLNDGKSNLIKVDGISAEYARPIRLRMLHKIGERIGGGYTNGVLSLDSDSKTIVYEEDEDGFPIENLSDGNDFSEIMKYHVVHEFFHYIQEGTQIPYASVSEEEHKWVLEGTAKMFEDIVYDLENPYTFAAFNVIFRKNRDDQVINILEDIDKFDSAYQTFIFWKLMQEKCRLDVQKMLINPFGNLKEVANSCSDIPNIYDDKLAGIFTLYNWAMILYNDMSLLEEDESSVFLLHFDVKKIDEPNFQGTLDMSSKVGGSIPKFGAKSFLITNATLNSSQNINLTFKSSGDTKLVAVRVKSDGSSDVNDNFTMDSSTQEYRLEDKDKSGSLFVTLVNTTDKKIDILDLNLIDKRFTRDANTDIVTDHQRGLQWQDETLTWLDSWYGANRHCTALTLGAYNDWRVPTYIELVYIVDLAGPPYVYKEFEHLGAVGYWSLELNGGVFPNSESAKVVNFGLATWIWINTSSRMNTRCVREYQVSSALSKQSRNMKIDNSRVIKEGNYEELYQDNNNDMGGEYISY